jgi:hypothetical protein
MGIRDYWRETGAEPRRREGGQQEGEYTERDSERTPGLPENAARVPREWVAGRWERSRLSLHLAPDYRARPPSTAHAVCAADSCEVHFDDHHPRERPLAHLARDAVPALLRRLRWLRGVTDWSLQF